MTDTLAQSWQPGANPRRRSHVRWAAFLLGTATVFSLGLYCWPTPVRGYVARVSLALWSNTPLLTAGNSSATEALAQIRDEALSNETLRAALSQVGPPGGVARGDVAFPTDAEIDFVRQHVQVHPRESANTSELAYDLQFTGVDSAWSLAFVSSLAESTLAGFDERAAQTKAGTTDEVADRLALAERYEQSARAALDDFLNRHFDEFNQLAKASRQVPPPDSSPTGVRRAEPEPANVPPKVNPKWQSLSEQISTVTAELDRILLDRTLEHPQAKEAAVKLESLRRQLESTPKYQAEGPTARRGPVGAGGKSAVQPVQFSQAGLGAESVAPGRMPSAGHEYERLLAELRRAREERHAALQEASLSLKPATPALAVVRGKIVANAHLAQTLREAPSTGRLTVLALISLLSGASLAALIRNPRTSRVYASSAEIEADLSLPVVCVLPAPVSPAAALSR